MRNILILLTLFTFAVVELSAQTTSSAAQVVTFGVQRMGAQVSLASNVMNNTSRNLLKVTAGYELRSQDLVQFSPSTGETTVAAKMSTMNAPIGLLQPVSSQRDPNPSISKSGITKAAPSSKSFVTVTE